jgi:hypothetical protein
MSTFTISIILWHCRRVRALAAYKDFLTLWKDADPDIPILKQAKAEYAKLNNRKTSYSSPTVCRWFT